MRGHTEFSEEWLAEWLRDASQETKKANSHLYPEQGESQPSSGYSGSIYHDDCDEEPVPEKSQARVVAGRNARETGEHFEEMVSLMNEQVQCERGFVAFCGHRTRVISKGKGGTLQVIHTGVGPPDIMGALDGFPVVFEVKHVMKGKSFRFKSHTAKSKGNWHQFEAICSAGKCGAFAGAFIWWVSHQEYRWHSWEMFDQKGATRVSDGIVVNSWLDAFEAFKEKRR